MEDNKINICVFVVVRHYENFSNLFTYSFLHYNISSISKVLVYNKQFVETNIVVTFLIEG